MERLSSSSSFDGRNGCNGEYRCISSMATAVFHFDIFDAEEVSIVQASMLLPCRISGMSRVGDAIKNAITRVLWAALSERCKRGKTDADEAG